MQVRARLEKAKRGVRKRCPVSARPERKEVRPVERPDQRRSLYWLDVAGRAGWRARYLKEVDANETTVRFWQEIYDETDRLVEIHEKFPVKKGHQKL